METQYVYHDTIPQYAFVGWSPSPGQTISEFGTIFLQRSSGRDPAVLAAEQARKKAEEDAKKKAEAERRKKEKQPPQPPQPR